MRYTTLLVVHPDTKEETDHFREYGNSWGSAIVVWEAIYNKYIPKRYQYQSFMDDQVSLWPLYNDPRLDICERKILLATYDNWYIRSADVPAFCEAMEGFLYLHPPVDGTVNHLQAIAADMAQAIAENPNIPAFGFWWTSVSDCPFEGPWIEEEDDMDTVEERAPFNWDQAFDWGAEFREEQESSG
jgi:hypothetical protein